MAGRERRKCAANPAEYFMRTQIRALVHTHQLFRTVHRDGGLSGRGAVVASSGCDEGVGGPAKTARGGSVLNGVLRWSRRDAVSKVYVRVPEKGEALTSARSPPAVFIHPTGGRRRRFPLVHARYVTCCRTLRHHCTGTNLEPWVSRGGVTHFFFFFQSVKKPNSPLYELVRYCNREKLFFSWLIINSNNWNCVFLQN